MGLIDYLKGIGILGFIILYILILLFVIIAPILVAIFITNFIGVTGIYWWAFVVVIWFIIANIMFQSFSK